MNTSLLAILVLCVLLIPVYYKTVRFDHFWGVLLFILGFSALFLRLTLIKSYPLVGVFNSGTISQSSLLIIGPAIVFIFFGVFSKNFKRRIRGLKKLFFPYVFFGALQQILFLWIFCDSVFYLTKNVPTTFILTVLFFISVHLNWEKQIMKFWILLLLFAIINTWVYMVWGNIIPQFLVHGAAGAILFTEFTDTDQIKRRFG